MSWESEGTRLLTASLVRPIGLAAAAWLMLRLFRVRHPASRHAATLALMGMAVVCMSATAALDEQNVPAPATVHAQPFEVASVKISQPSQGRGRGAICLTPCYGERIMVEHSRVDISTITLGRLMITAYRIRPYQLSGPGWLTDWGSDPHFDIQAKIPDGVSKDRVPEMLQALLAERFKLAIHHETRELPVYALVVGKDGPKLKESPDADAPVPDSSVGNSLYSPQGDAHELKDGGTVLTGSPWGTVRMTMGPDGTMREDYSRVTMAALAELISGPFDRPVVDMTNLKGTYQIAWDRPGLGGGRRGSKSAADGPPTDFRSEWAAQNTRMIEKLGLKLESRRAPVDVIVVDRIEKMPTEN